MARYSGLILLTGAVGEVDPASLFETLSPFALKIVEIEEITIKGRLILTVHITLDKAHASSIETDLEELGKKTASDIAVIFEESVEATEYADSVRVALIAQTLVPQNVTDLSSLISTNGGFITRIRTLPCSEFTALLFEVRRCDRDQLAERVRELSRTSTLDAYVLPSSESLAQRGLLVMDVDSTLINQEVIELLGARAGKADEIKAITDRAMAGELDFESSLRDRVSLLSGLSESVLEEVQNEITLTPGATELLKSVHEAGHTVGLVSGGFTTVISPLAQSLGITHVRANTLEIKDGLLTGGIVGPVIDRAAKENALRE